MKKSFFLTFGLIFFTSILFTINSNAQQLLTTPDISQAASVSQTIGLTKITIDYHRPGVKGRVIWGKLVPYNEVWRAGANENTTISFSDQVKINGQDLPAGTYGLHMIPTENDWTIIFSKNIWSWGSFFYNQKEDALRIKVKPVTNEFREWLDYSFDDPSDTSAEVALLWEKMKIPFKVSVNVDKVVLNHFQMQLENLPGFNWRAFSQAAAYFLNKNDYLDQASKWIDRSIGMNKNGTNLWIKASILEKQGMNADAEKIKKDALSIATEQEINAFGYQYLFAKELDKAIDMFKMNVEKYPDSWNVYDSLGEAYNEKGEKGRSIKNYKKAYEMVTDDQNKQRIKNILDQLEN